MDSTEAFDKEPNKIDRSQITPIGSRYAASRPKPQFNPIARVETLNYGVIELGLSTLGDSLRAYIRAQPSVLGEGATVIGLHDIQPLIAALTRARDEMRRDLEQKAEAAGREAAARANVQRTKGGA